MPEVLYEVRGGVCAITINRPEARNALSPATLRALREHFERAATDPEVRVVVLTGAGDRAFSSGADLTAGEAGTFADLRSFDAYEERAGFPALFRAMHACPRPVVGKVRGYCLAGGFGVALACDLLVAAETAVFGTPEVRVGLFPMVIFAEISRNVGLKRAMELVLTGSRIDARRAEALGIVNRVVPEARLDEEVEALAQEIGKLSPSVLGLGKRACYAALDMGYAESLEFLRSQLTVNLLTEDAAEGLNAFREKREPRFRGR
jgi:enoyl-CoA hydratase/carnithine racemase